MEPTRRLLTGYSRAYFPLAPLFLPSGLTFAIGIDSGCGGGNR
jgi:hypothetical protein